MDISSGKLIFTPQPKPRSGCPYFLCWFQVQDTGGTANGGKGSRPDSGQVLNIQLAKVNHVPWGSGTVSAFENMTYILKQTDFGFT